VTFSKYITITMKFIATAVAILSIFFVPAMAQDKEAEAIRDLQLGLQGLQEAAKNPALLAQLMQDLQVSSIGIDSISRSWLMSKSLMNVSCPRILK
jgi:membrane protein insertase Oxa1/YidC/SpoIIIJ